MCERVGPKPFFTNNQILSTTSFFQFLFCTRHYTQDLNNSPFCSRATRSLSCTNGKRARTLNLSIETSHVKSYNSPFCSRATHSLLCTNGKRARTLNF